MYSYEYNITEQRYELLYVCEIDGKQKCSAVYATQGMYNDPEYFFNSLVTWLNGIERYRKEA